MSKEINVKAQTLVDCVFTVERVGPGDDIRENREFHNLILNSGMDALADKSLSDMMNTCHVGTGGSEPDVTDNSLEQELVSTDNRDQDDGGGQAEDPLHSWIRRRWVFPEGAAAGNLSEVGISDGDSPTLLNRQLFRDENGDPITITILSDEVLRVTAEGRVYSDIQMDESTTGSFQLNGQTINFTREVPSDFLWVDGSSNACSDNIGATTFQIDSTTTSIRHDNVVYDEYINGTYERTITAVWEAGAIGGPLNAIRYGPDYDDLYVFNIDNPPTIADTEELTLNFYRTWGRYTGTP